MEQEIAWLLRDKYNGAITPEFEHDKERLLSGEPLAYVIGWVPFFHTKIFLDSKPHIPRPETEYWVGKTVELIKERNHSNPKILDLCAGSGCVGIALLKALPEAHVYFAEQDIRYHETIRKNVQENALDESHVRMLDGDLFEHSTDTYDVIVSNPPYINPELRQHVQESVLNHEPHEALFGGKDGMEIIKRILTKIPQVLNPGGFLVLEHEPEQEKSIKDLLPGIVSYKDQFGIVRYSVFIND